MIARNKDASMKLKDVDIIAEKEVRIESQGDSEREGLWPVERVRPVLEALLFAAGDALPIHRICEILAGPTREEVYAALRSIKDGLLRNGFRLVEVAGGWQFRTAPEHQAVIKRLFKEKPQRLTRAAVETAAIVAYRQPCTRQEIEAIRGVDCGGVLETLVERRLLRITGRRDVPGRPLVYATTKEFLELFGLKDLKSLPTLSELDDDLQALAATTGFAEASESGAAILPSVDEEAGNAQEQQAEQEGCEQGLGQAPHEEGRDRRPHPNEAGD